MRKKIKSNLQIQHKYLGTLLYFKDSKKRGCLKLSFKNKIEGLMRATDAPTNLPVPAKVIEPVSFDISYKFEDSFLEIKKIVNGKIEREFYKVPLPICDILFFIRIKDWHCLDDADTSLNPLILTPPSNDSSVAIVFSFLGTNGRPFTTKNYDFPNGMGTIDLPETPLSQFCIGIAGDGSNTDTNNFSLQVPLEDKSKVASKYGFHFL